MKLPIINSTQISFGAGIAIALVVGYLAYSFLIQPSVDSIATQEASTVQTEIKAQQLEVIAAERETVLSNGAKIYADYLKALDFVPNEEQLAQVLSDVETDAKGRNLTIVKFDASHAGTKSPVGQISERALDAEITGEHPALMNFLQAISQNKRLTEVRAVTAVADPTTKREKLTFNMAAYYSAEKFDVPEGLRKKMTEPANVAQNNPNEAVNSGN